jgi:hypothetical protein
MKKNIPKKLTLNKESLHELGKSYLGVPAAGGSTTRMCATCPPYYCPKP